MFANHNSANTSGLINGGLAGLFWSYLWTFVRFLFIVASLAEMSSMAPTSGGQYHWVSEFAPRRYQKPLSYFSGWMSTLSWQAGTAGMSFILGVLIQSIIVVYNPSYVPQRWQQTLFVFAFAFVQVIGNTVAVRQLPILQKLVMIPHGLGWIAVFITLWCLAPKGTAKDVFISFTSNGGWEPIGLSVMVGSTTAVYFLIRECLKLTHV
jgi:choline transport protein